LEPSVLILDEPNEGIQPNIVKQIGDVILKLNKEEGLTVILVEQKLGFARRVGKEFRLMEKGRIVAADKMENLNDTLIKQYLAV
jgi:urea transport system ATP-binding protein